MISRRGAKTIAETYSKIYVYVNSGIRGDRTATFYQDSLYDFLYVSDFDDWIMNRMRSVRVQQKPRALTDFIMKLHTGESLQDRTPDWTIKQRTLLGQRLL